MGIEELGARWAIEKAHKKLVVELEKNISISEDKISKGNVRAFVDMDAHFHEIISKLSGRVRPAKLIVTFLCSKFSSWPAMIALP